MLRYLTAGESHGEALIGIVEGMPAGVPITADDLNVHLARRWLGFGRGGRSKIERDRVHIYSGVRYARTIAAPIALRLDNAAYAKDRTRWPDIMAVEKSGDCVQPITLPRPGHADLVGVQKYRFDDIRSVSDRASARETAMRVACCTVARVLLKQVGIEIGSHVIGIGRVRYSSSAAFRSLADNLAANGAEAVNQAADASEVRMLDAVLSGRCINHIKEAKRAGDSLGGTYEVIATGVPAGLGSYVHWDRRLGGILGQAIMSIHAQKAVEIGDCDTPSGTPGSKYHDPICKDGDTYKRQSNHAGGIEGGISNGMPIILRGHMKPIPTLTKPLRTVDIVTGKEQNSRYERSDFTSVPAASTVAEATVAFALANAFLEKFGGDSLAEISERYRAG